MRVANFFSIAEFFMKFDLKFLKMKLSKPKIKDLPSNWTQKTGIKPYNQSQCKIKATAAKEKLQKPKLNFFGFILTCFFF